MARNILNDDGDDDDDDDCRVIMLRKNSLHTRHARGAVLGEILK